MLGLPKGIVQLCRYDEKWPAHYDNEVKAIQSKMSHWIAAAHHIGSTAVPDLEAKPIIDIALSMHNIDDVSRCSPLLEEMGYEDHGEFVVKGSYFFSRGDPTIYNLHLVERGSHYLARWLFFRDELKRNAGLIDQYAKLKHELQQRYCHDRNAYSAGKDAFVEQVLKAMKID